MLKCHAFHRILATGEDVPVTAQRCEYCLDVRILGGSLCEDQADAFAVRDNFSLRGLHAERLL